MDFDEVLFRSEMIEKENEDRLKEKLTAAAYTAFLQGAGGVGKSWIDYQVGIGLMKKPKPPSKVAKQKMVEKSRTIAEKIMRMDRSRAQPKQSKQRKKR